MGPGSLALRERGYALDLSVGMSHFRCDIAARRHGGTEYRLGVLVDTQIHYQQSDLIERELMRPQLLRGFGWTVAHVLTRDWYHDRQSVVDRMVRLIEEGEAPPPTPSDSAEPPVQEDSQDAWAEWDGPAEIEVAVPTSTAPSAAAEQVDTPPADSEPPPAVPPVPDSTAPSPPDITGPSPTRRYFEFIGGTSYKFWEVQVSANAVIVRFGRIGTNGQTQTKVFANPPAASAAAQRLINEKLRKGYSEKPPAAETGAG